MRVVVDPAVRQVRREGLAVRFCHPLAWFNSARPWQDKTAGRRLFETKIRPVLAPKPVPRCSKGHERAASIRETLVKEEAWRRCCGRIWKEVC